MDDKFTNPPARLPIPKPTVEVEQPPAWAIAFGEKLDKLRGTVGANHEIVMHAIDGLRSRVGNLESWRSESEERQRKHSGGIQKVSVNDASQDAAIAQVITRVDAVEAKVDSSLVILQRLDKLTEHPMVRRVAYAVGAALLSYLTAKGLLR
jgi:hypothetical protein